MNKQHLIFSRDSLHELDRRAVQEFGIPILVLMENAGRAVAEAARNMLRVAHLKSPSSAPAGILILAGPGNNGGDGLVAARWLHNWGIRVSILLMADRDKYKDAAAVQLRTVEAMKLPVDVVTPGHAEFRDWLVEAGPDDLIIDAIFGTGLARDVEGVAAEMIRAANNSHHRILAVDLPSGMDCDSGKELGVAIRATETVSFCGLKRGFASAKTLTGHVTVADIGAPQELLAAMAD